MIITLCKQNDGIEKNSNDVYCYVYLLIIRTTCKSTMLFSKKYLQNIVISIWLKMSVLPLNNCSNLGFCTWLLICKLVMGFRLISWYSLLRRLNKLVYVKHLVKYLNQYYIIIVAVVLQSGELSFPRVFRAGFERAIIF